MGIRMRRNHIEVFVIGGLCVLLACLLVFIGVFIIPAIRAESIASDIVAKNRENISEATERQPYGMQTVVTTMNEVTEAGGDVQVVLDAFADNGIIFEYTIEPERIIVIMADGTEWHYVLMESE